MITMKGNYAQRTFELQYPILRTVFDYFPLNSGVWASPLSGGSLMGNWDY